MDRGYYLCREFTHWECQTRSFCGFLCVKSPKFHCTQTDSLSERLLTPCAAAHAALAHTHKRAYKNTARNARRKPFLLCSSLWAGMLRCECKGTEKGTVGTDPK